MSSELNFTAFQQSSFGKLRWGLETGEILCIYVWYICSVYTCFMHVHFIYTCGDQITLNCFTLQINKLWLQHTGQKRAQEAAGAFCSLPSPITPSSSQNAPSNIHNFIFSLSLLTVCLECTLMESIRSVFQWSIWNNTFGEDNLYNAVEKEGETGLMLKEDKLFLSGWTSQ